MRKRKWMTELEKKELMKNSQFQIVVREMVDMCKWLTSGLITKPKKIKLLSGNVKIKKKSTKMVEIHGGAWHKFHSKFFWRIRLYDVKHRLVFSFQEGCDIACFSNDGWVTYKVTPGKHGYKGILKCSPSGLVLLKEIHGELQDYTNAKKEEYEALHDRECEIRDEVIAQQESQIEDAKQYIESILG